MLKERIDFLCQTQNISRKQMVDGLITLPHLSNILLGRYALAEDLAVQFAKTLHVAPSYLLKAEDETEEIQKQCEDLLTKIILYGEQSTFAFCELPERQDSLTLELVSNLVKAIFFQYSNNRQQYQQLHEDYLDYFLKEYKDKDFLELPIPLRKAYYFYKAQYFRGTQNFESANAYLEELISLYRMEPETWLQLKKMAVECLLNIDAFDTVYASLEEMFYVVRKSNLLHHLTSLYITQSVYYLKLGLMEAALISLSQAEENLNLVQDGVNNYIVPIYNNRISILIQLRQNAKASSELSRFESLLEANHLLEEGLIQYLDSFRCEILLKTHQLKALKDKLDHWNQETSSLDTRMNLTFYRGVIAYSEEQWVISQASLQECLNYYEEQRNKLRLLEIYDLLAKLSKQNGKYKKAAEYYEKMLQIYQRE